MINRFMVYLLQVEHPVLERLNGTLRLCGLEVPSPMGGMDVTPPWETVDIVVPASQPEWSEDGGTDLTAVNRDRLAVSVGKI